MSSRKRLVATDEYGFAIIVLAIVLLVSLFAVTRAPLEPFVYLTPLIIVVSIAYIVIGLLLIRLGHKAQAV